MSWTSRSTCSRAATASTRPTADRTTPALLLYQNFTIVATTLPAALFDRSVFFAGGRNPKPYGLVVVKSPHCEPHMFVDWAAGNFGIDAPGSTSAKLTSLGHSVCRLPMYPLELDTSFEASATLYAR